MRQQLAGQHLPGSRHHTIIAGHCGPDAVRRKGSDHNLATGYPDRNLKRGEENQREHEEVSRGQWAAGGVLVLPGALK